MKSFWQIALLPLYFFGFFGSAVVANPILTRETSTAYFTKAPRLLGASATFKSVRARNARYYFNLELPQDAGNNLQQITIAQRQGQENIRFRLEDTVAYIGTNRRKQTQLAIANVAQNDETGEITVIFKHSIPPNTTFTVGLKARENPAYDGVYLFGVTAFPQGDNPTGLYLGAGRLHFYRGGSFSHY